MTFTPADKTRMLEIEAAIRNARTPPSNGDEEGSFPNDVALLTKAQEKLNDLLALILHRML
jgi:hypothetical protein